MRRWPVLAMAIALAPFVLAPVAHADEADDSLTGYIGTASGALFSIQPIFPGLLPTGDAPFEITGGLTSSNVQSGGNAFSRAEVLWPGDGAANLGPLLAQGAGQPIFYQMPAYPLGVQANQDSEPISQGVTPGPVVKASGKSGKAESLVQAGGGGIPGVFTFGSVSSSSKSDVVNGELISEAIVVLHDVVLGDGTVVMDAIKSISTVTSNGESSESKGNTTVIGLAIGGQGGALDSEGLKGADPLVKGMQEALNAAGIEITVLGGAGKAEGGTADRLSAGVLVTIANPVAAANPQFEGSRFVISLAPTAAGALASPPFEDDFSTAAGGIDGVTSGGFGSISSSISDTYGAPTTTGSSISSGGKGSALPSLFEPIRKVLPDVGGVPGGMVLALLAGMFFGTRWLSRFAGRFIPTED
jgi:hypothetical protein